MKTYHINIPNQGLGSMLNQKTYEDFNKATPNPNDLGLNEPTPIFALPFIIDDGTVVSNDKKNGWEVEPNKTPIYKGGYDNSMYNYLHE